MPHTDLETRLECLRLATSLSHSSPSGVVALAERMHEWALKPTSQAAASTAAPESETKAAPSAQRQKGAAQ